MRDLPSDSAVRRARLSRMLVIGLAVWVLGFVALAAWIARTPPRGAERRVSPFVPWDGEWEGEFLTYAFDGKLPPDWDGAWDPAWTAHEPAGPPLRRLQVRQSYKHIPENDKFRQEGRFTVIDAATGEESIEIGINTSDFEGGNLLCRVYRDAGRDMIAHGGEWDGAAILWRRRQPWAVETFREWIDGDTYEIRGVALYGDPAAAEPLYTIGRYRRPAGPEG